MALPLENIEVGKCYLTNTGQVRRVVRILPDGRVQFDYRYGATVLKRQWPSNILDGRSFALLVQREVPCDWTPGAGQ